ncbi:hypothetical protein [Sediminicurvatus halobius]|uniref:Uncharacterized protein n=1 Tax=Sediminicurvatus halobius TaxID=2182432 RepID=A0A2U2MWG9_9GAMM|nr:hypothetical protein [Spiribacter halobius]PWG61136.1 hypothetical protein DEM34_18045 [Spiribacter halobius]UEX77704.1 hypothetical protein LMH63_17505 [Spiribacter halobius]
MNVPKRFVRRHYLVAPTHIEKVRELSERHGISASAVVRRAIDAYAPEDAVSQEQAAAAALDSMSEALRDTRAQLAAMRERLDERMSESYREREREHARQEVRAYFAAHPEELDALSDYLGGLR